MGNYLILTTRVTSTSYRYSLGLFAGRCCRKPLFLGLKINIVCFRLSQYKLGTWELGIFSWLRWASHPKQGPNDWPRDKIWICVGKLRSHLTDMMDGWELSQPRHSFISNVWKLGLLYCLPLAYSVLFCWECWRMSTSSYHRSPRTASQLLPQKHPGRPIRPGKQHDHDIVELPLNVGVFQCVFIDGYGSKLDTPMLRWLALTIN
jgi:hypothetical protein